MAESPKRLPAIFFRTTSGDEPVRDWLKSDLFSREDRLRIGESIKLVEYGWPLGMPICRPLGAGLWEVRIYLHTRTARILFGIYDGSMVLLHGFIKKTQTTPQQDIDLARKRIRELKEQL